VPHVTAADLDLLAAEWGRLLSPFGAHPARVRGAFAELTRRYGEPHRHYHTLDHVAEVLRGVRRLCPDADARPELLLAGWFHDVVYDTHASDNEARSAEHAGFILVPLGVPGPVLEETARLILLTQSHTTAGDDSTGQVLLDSDLAVLAADEPAYDSYARAIRREYDWVPGERYREGRRRALEAFLGRPRIYATEVMFATGEARARANLRREIASLGG
jgi:predicted metal-dependent HD superfamily phosphohydrolase